MSNEVPEPPAQEALVILARLLRPQGRKGEVLADLLTDFPERFAVRQGVSLRQPNGELLATAVEAHWLPVGKNAGRVVLKLLGVDSIADAERLAGLEVVVPAELRAELEEDAAYITDLLDCTLIDTGHLDTGHLDTGHLDAGHLDAGNTIGIVEDVHFPTNTSGVRLVEAAPMLVVRSAAGGELLIPFARAWIESIDFPRKRIVMRLPEGLLDING